MSARILALRRGKSADNQRFSHARSQNDQVSRLLLDTLGAGVNLERRSQIFGDPGNVHQFALIWDDVVGMFTHPVVTPVGDGTNVVLGNFTSTIGAPCSGVLPRLLHYCCATR